MLRIRRVYDDTLPVNREIIRQVKEILRTRFPAAPREDIDQLGEKLRNPFKQRFRSVLFVAQTLKGRVQGFALLLHEPEIGFTFLDWIAMAGGKAGSGIGGALYDRVRQESLALAVKGLFFECLPDAPDRCPDTALLKENQDRLRFYEQYGARPIVDTAYESPVNAGDTCMPHLVYDGLEAQRPLRRSFARKVVRAVLERKYAALCPADYVERVVASFRDDPVALREYRYLKPEAARTRVDIRTMEQIPLIVNDRHDIHHVHDRGYVEAPVRVRSILAELEKSGRFTLIKPQAFPDKHILAVHDSDLFGYLRRACAEVPEGKSVYPYIFPIRNKARPPKEPSVLAGYYCIDTFTPVNRNAYPAARRGVDCVLTAVREILRGHRLAYALVRPPGHHAERQAFGGFCYFNNTAVAAQYLCAYGKVAILDIDYHHGNGQQDIFYQRNDVLTLSIHGHPSFAYPYFSGFAEEQGDGDGEGFNLNLPLPEAVDGPVYRRTLEKAVTRIRDFNPQFLVVALGLDTAKGDPTGTWSLRVKDFEENGRIIGAMGFPTVVIQEGGYRNRTLGRNAMGFFKGLIEAHHHWGRNRQEPRERLHGVGFREVIEPPDVERVRRLVDITGFFSAEEVAIAAELVQERLEKGPDSGYEFVMGDHYGRLAGYTCFGRIPGTTASFDLYWIAVHPEFQGRGLGRRLLQESERRIKAVGGARIYVDTSQRSQYAGTRAFYESCGYRLETVLADFYSPGDGKAIYCKVIG
ncbi:GNAT family N-acetyltransferase [Desulfococcus multivorans]|uniref:Histone deacetylase domain containing protein n=1 Tax=Desulfococcus multivorans DSM 2059 TaxID=1121405 RepID=S7V5A6_DESML|nr:GNAT family N-acetyltransferase [Desulfococcus multivorans]AOY56825.1 histone deacetylase superfamily protein [Desulfococcus multivorans]AQU99371.1 acetylpolyamine amidohydrolase [Desulfococcus multivorans]EPR41839.1 Histone deacetylase domain containing protein [Desulfococcus multivorans DSM 2059]SJZ92845.1 Acetoin utilization deacetylase AcuC [Desulfococcus multivorans DSM 2059]